MTRLVCSQVIQLTVSKAAIVYPFDEDPIGMMERELLFDNDVTIEVSFLCGEFIPWFTSALSKHSYTRTFFQPSLKSLFQVSKP